EGASRDRVLDGVDLDGQHRLVRERPELGCFLHEIDRAVEADVEIERAATRVLIADSGAVTVARELGSLRAHRRRLARRREVVGQPSRVELPAISIDGEVLGWNIEVDVRDRIGHAPDEKKQDWYCT